MKSTAFSFTINNYTPEIEDLLQKREGFVVYGYEEAPTTGTKHLQGYMETDIRVYTRSLGKLYKGHFEVAKGSCYQNFKYCTKSGRYWTNDEMFNGHFLVPKTPIEDDLVYYQVCCSLSQCADHETKDDEDYLIKLTTDLLNCGFHSYCTGHASRFLHDHQ